MAAGDVLRTSAIAERAGRAAQLPDLRFSQLHLGPYHGNKRQCAESVVILAGARGLGEVPMSEVLQHLPQGPTATILYEMRIRYREDRAAQAAAHLLKLAGGRMNHMKLIKLLYFADRAALLSSGRPITFDSYVSMPHGPVLSFTLDRINDGAPPDGSSYWLRVISERQGHEVSLLGDAPNDQLSPAEEHLLGEIWIRYGHLTQWELRDLSPTLPEWQDPSGSSLPIDIRDILLSEGMTETDAQELLDALHAEVLADRLMTG